MSIGSYNPLLSNKQATVNTMSATVNQSIFIGNDKFGNPRFRLDSEHDAKSIGQITSVTKFLKTHHEKLYSPVFSDPLNDFGLITLHRILGLDVDVGATYSFSWKCAISTNLTGKKFVKVSVANFAKVSDAHESEDIDIPFE